MSHRLFSAYLLYIGGGGGAVLFLFLIFVWGAEHLLLLVVQLYI